jgi:hypothetical protein
MENMMPYCILFALTILFPSLALSLGRVSSNVMEIFGHVNTVFSGVSTIAGIGMLCASFVQYKHHKRNRLQVPISRPIIFFILGLALMALPYAGELTIGGGIANNA